MVDLLTGFPFSSTRYVDHPSGVKLLRGDNVVQGQLRWDDAKRWPKEAAPEVRDYLLQDGDVVLAMDRPWIEAGLKFSRVTFHDLPCLLVQRVARLRARPGLDQRFLSYLIGSISFTQHVLAVQTGTAVPHISPTQIREFSFAVPPIAEQRAIAAILGALDDKIELNRRMIRTLEAMAQALFQSWFVDFDPVRAKMAGRQPTGMDAETAALFPTSFAETSNRAIPDGWSLARLNDLATINREQVNPTAYADELFDHYSIPAFDDGAMPRVEYRHQIQSVKFAVVPDAVLLSKLNPRIPRVWLPTTDRIRRSLCSTEFLVLRPKSSVSRVSLWPAPVSFLR